MARTQLPPPLPPETRTVGQLVAEAIRLYGARFWPSLALGIGPGLLGVAAAELHGAVRVAIVAGLGPLVLASSYAGAVALVRPIGRGRYVAVALAAGYLAFLPVCISRLWIFPGIYVVALAWLALVGLAVPAALVERRGYADALRRGVQLARADYVHALGSLATLAITIFLTGLVIFFSLREVNKDVEELGARVVHQWATLGEYDFVNVVEAPDSATIARVSVALGARGSTKIRTLTALTIDEFLAAVG